MTARFTSNYQGIGQMLQSAPLQADMRRRANKVRQVAQSTAPVDTGTYRGAFAVESGVRPGRKPRAFGRVTNTAPHAIDVEYGARSTPRYRVLGRALSAAGE